MMMLLTTFASAVLTDYVWHNATNLTLRNHYSWGGARMAGCYNAFWCALARTKSTASH